MGVRIALHDIADLGFRAAIIIFAAMAITIVVGVAVARLLGQRGAYGALAGTATAICGASAALATAAVLPDYKGKQADIVFTVIGVNALSTVAMIFYPLFAYSLRLDEAATGVLIGGTIHDVAQVVGAGYAVSDTAGNTAVVVKLFRVFLLLPFVVAIGLFFNHQQPADERTNLPVPGFAIAFLFLCILNTWISWVGLDNAFADIKGLLVNLSNWGLLIAIAALGLGSSLTLLAQLGWRPVATLVATTLIILAAVTLGLIVL